MTRDRFAKAGHIALLGASLLVGSVALSALDSTPASARGFITFGVGLPVAPAPYYYYGPGYYYAPTYYAPTYYAPPVYAPPAPAAVAPSASISHDYCREYHSTQTINGQPQNMVGTACRQPDGSWRIVQ